MVDYINEANTLYEVMGNLNQAIAGAGCAEQNFAKFYSDFPLMKHQENVFLHYADLNAKQVLLKIAGSSHELVQSYVRGIPFLPMVKQLDKDMRDIRISPQEHNKKVKELAVIIPSAYLLEKKARMWYTTKGTPQFQASRLDEYGKGFHFDRLNVMTVSK